MNKTITVNFTNQESKTYVGDYKVYHTVLEIVTKDEPESSSVVVGLDKTKVIGIPFSSILNYEIEE